MTTRLKVAISALTTICGLQLVLADKYRPYDVTYENCHVFNPGSFAGSDFTWSMYDTAKRQSDQRYVIVAFDSSCECALICYVPFAADSVPETADLVITITGCQSFGVVELYQISVHSSEMLLYHLNSDRPQRPHRSKWRRAAIRSTSHNWIYPLDIA